MGEQPRSIGWVPGDRPGQSLGFLLTPPRHYLRRARLPCKQDPCPPRPRPRPVSRKARVKIAIRAVRYRRGGMFLAALRWHAPRADTAAPLPPALNAYETATLAAGGEPTDDLTPALPVLIARTILTAAPPSSRAPVLAGAPA